MLMLMLGDDGKGKAHTKHEIYIPKIFFSPVPHLFHSFGSIH